MKTFYLGLFYIGFLFTLASCILPAKHGLQIDERLLGQSDKWDFTFEAPDHKLLGLTEGQSKKMLLVYLHDRRIFQPDLLGWLSPVFVLTTLFSLIGWRRELYLERKPRPGELAPKRPDL